MKKSSKTRGKYGYIEFVDPRQLKNDGWDDEIIPEIRKPTPAEREEIVLNFIREHSGKSVRVSWLAEKLAVSDRTIQTILKKFETQGLITRTPAFNKRGKQKGNILTYIGEDKPLTGTELTLKRLYNPKNPCGFRDWHWKSFKIIVGYYDKNFSKIDAAYQYEDLLYLKSSQQAKKEKFYKKKNNLTPDN